MTNHLRYRKDVSNQEVTQFMRPHLVELKKSVVLRQNNSPEDARDDISKPSKSGKTDTQISRAEKECLQSILDCPDLNTTERKGLLGYSTDQFNKQKNALKNKGLAVDVCLDIGNGTRGVSKMLDLTAKGYAALNLKPPFSIKNNVGPEHSWVQRRYADWCGRHKLKAILEGPLNGKRADVHVVKNGQDIAVEVEMSPANACSNVRQDIDAGFFKILVIGKNNSVSKAIKRNLEKLFPPEELRLVVVASIAELAFIKEIKERKRS